MQKRFVQLLRFGWPAFIVLIIDTFMMVWLSRVEFFLPARFSIIVSGLTLLAGWLTLVLQPSSQSRQAALFATLLASVLLTPPPTQTFNQAILLPFEEFSTLQIWRILNSLSMLPSIIHLVALFAENKKILKRQVLLPLYLSPIFWISGILILEKREALFWLRQIVLLWIIGVLLFLLYLLIQGMRNAERKDPGEVQQLRGILLVGILVMIPVFLRFGGLFFDIEIISYEAFLAGLVVLPLGVGYIILRHNLFGIDELVRRAVGYTLISVLASLILFIIATATGNRAATRMPEYRWGSIFVALLFLAIFFTPLQRWLQKRIDRWFYPERFNFQQRMRDVQQNIMQVNTASELKLLLEKDLPQSLGAGWARWVPGVLPQIPQIALEMPCWSTLLQVGKDILGGYWIAERRSGLPYSNEEKQQLEVLCQQAALALAYAQALDTVEEINLGLERRVAERSAQVSEQKQALAILTERRRIARDLHDSISQTLFSINLGARAIRKLAEREPQTAMEELLVLEKSAQTAQQEMRSLLNELREPPQAEPAGTINLVEQIKDHFAQLAALPGPDGLPPLLKVKYEGPDAVWLTVSQAVVLFQVCREALHNIIKHAGVRDASVQLKRSPENISMHIEDHGQGFVGDLRVDAMGLESMRSRLAQIGGGLVIDERLKKGSKIIATIPWEEQR